MNKPQLAQNLAVSLSIGAWSQSGIATILAQRLPAFAQDNGHELALCVFKNLNFTYAPDAKAISRILLASAQFEQVFKQCQKHKTWPAQDLSIAKMRPVQAFSKLSLPQLVTSVSLAD